MTVIIWHGLGETVFLGDVVLAFFAEFHVNGRVEMEKPEKETTSRYDYHQCRDYLQEKYGYDERDYAGHFGEPARQSAAVAELGDERPYWDFWHWVCDNKSVANGCVVFFHEENADDMEDWQREIHRHYMDEFAENGVAEFWCWW